MEISAPSEIAKVTERRERRDIDAMRVRTEWGMGGGGRSGLHMRSIKVDQKSDRKQRDNGRVYDCPNPVR
jgi:hypothetical protein